MQKSINLMGLHEKSIVLIVASPVRNKNFESRNWEEKQKIFSQNTVFVGKTKENW